MADLGTSDDNGEAEERDGNWSMDGHQGMFRKLSKTGEKVFLEEELEAFQKEKEASGGALQFDQEFLHLEKVLQAGPSQLEQEWAKVQQGQLHPRNLRIADALARMAAEGRCPPRIRIRSIPAARMKELLDLKQQGNQAFGAKDYPKAIDFYQKALACMDYDMYVGPRDQMETIVTILSNQAECYLRVKTFQKAGTVATNALLFDNSHEKSRMRRAKAELAIAGASYLIQALVDLEEIINEKSTTTGVQQAKELLPQVQELIAMEKETTKRTKNATEEDWEMYVRTVRSSCW